MRSEDDARAAAHEAMFGIVQSTCRLNGARLAAGLQSIDNIGLDILSGAFDGVIAWAVTCRPDGMSEAEFAAKTVASLQEMIVARTTRIGRPAGRA